MKFSFCRMQRGGTASSLGPGTRRATSKVRRQSSTIYEVFAAGRVRGPDARSRPGAGLPRNPLRRLRLQPASWWPTIDALAIAELRTRDADTDASIAPAPVLANHRPRARRTPRRFRPVKANGAGSTPRSASRVGATSVWPAGQRKTPQPALSLLRNPDHQRHLLAQIPPGRVVGRPHGGGDLPSPLETGIVITPQGQIPCAPQPLTRRVHPRNRPRALSKWCMVWR